MSEFEHQTGGPLVARTPEEAAEMMISEGGPLGSAVTEPWEKALTLAGEKFREAVREHPLPCLLAALGLGLMVGGALHRD